jgi:hypothetical protein
MLREADRYRLRVECTTTTTPFSGLSARRSVTAPQLWSAFAELRSERPDLQVLSWLLGPDDDVLPWVQSVGARPCYRRTR